MTETEAMEQMGYNFRYQYYIVFLVGQAAIYLLILSILEDREQNSLINLASRPNVYEHEVALDSDVLKEIEDVSTSQKYPVKVQNLEKSYKANEKVIKNLSFGIESNQIFGLLGPNGAGKSTTFNAMVGLLSKDKGSIAYQNKEFRFDSQLLVHFGISAQKPSL